LSKLKCDRFVIVFYAMSNVHQHGSNQGIAASCFHLILLTETHDLISGFDVAISVFGHWLNH
jgi:hypothetical protein